jgi:hypothetical protein
MRANSHNNLQMLSLSAKLAWAEVWHLWTVIIPRRSITGGCAGMDDGSKFPAVGRVDNFYRCYRSTARLLTHPFSGDAGQHHPRDLYRVASP